MSEIGRCNYEPCGQTDLLPYDGYCSTTCREQAEAEAMFQQANALIDQIVDATRKG